MTMLDTALALGAQTILVPDEIVPTHEATAKFQQPITLETQRVRFAGRVLSSGCNVIASEGRAEDAAGGLFARSNSTCIVLRMEG